MTRSVAVGTATVHIMQAAEVARGADELAKTLVRASEAEIRNAFGDRSPIAWSFNPVLIQAGDHRILVDAGLRSHSDGPVQGIVDLLSEIGVEPTSVTHIVITHGHGDHVGGLIDYSGLAVFPDAQLLVHQAEHRHWTEDQGSGDAGAMYRAATGPYAERISLFGSAGDEALAEVPLLNGDGISISARVLPGHTPGHCGLVLQADTSVLELGVDALHTDLQIPQPDWSVRFDTNPEMSAQTRKAYCAHLVQQARTVVWYHLPFPGVGDLEASDRGFTWNPSAG